MDHNYRMIMHHFVIYSIIIQCSSIVCSLDRRLHNRIRKQQYDISISTAHILIDYFDSFVCRFLSTDGGDYVNAITWHHYYFNGRTAVVDQFVNATIMNAFGDEIRTIRSIVNRYASSKRKQVRFGSNILKYSIV